MTDLNPQAKQMSDESMVRNLSAQATAIWPQEAPLFERYALSPQARILDAGCGTGEISSRLAERYPHSPILGIDIIDAHLALARQRYANLADRLRFERRDVYATGLPRGQFDLAVCRHVLHATPYPERVIAELAQTISGSVNLIVIKTPPGSAMMIASAVDEAAWPEILGTLGGDDTVMIVVRSAEEMPVIKQRFLDLKGSSAA